jgi:cell fate (sporulation/competence/biofilm development) regulator YlbF (YheA/YmcA/DUF963 family)
MMELSQEITQAAREFGAALREHPLVRAYQAACAAVQQDGELARLEEEALRLYNDLLSRQQAGEMLASREINHYYALRERLVRHPLIVERETRLKAVKPLFGQAGTVISSLLTVEYTSLAGDND